MVQSVFQNGGLVGVAKAYLESSGIGGSQEFTFTGSPQTFSVPAGTNSITVKMWGGAGGASDVSSSETSGAGGYAEATIDVTGQSSVTVYVGGGGEGSGDGSALGGFGYGNGGTGTGGGGGGGGSAILFGTTPVLVAGGGGGRSADQGSGGAGGGINGQDGTFSMPGGGAQGGTGGTVLDVNDATPGGDAPGGNGGNAGGGGGTSGGGGGGGGYAGGGGGGGGITSQEGGGGGGSGYANPTYCTSSSLIAGDLATPGNASDPDRPAGVAQGTSTTLANGGNGYVLIRYSAPATYQSGIWNLESVYESVLANPGVGGETPVYDPVLTDASVTTSSPLTITPNSGNMVLMYIRNATTTAPALPTGTLNVNSINDTVNGRSMRICYIVGDGTQKSISFSGSHLTYFTITGAANIIGQNTFNQQSGAVSPQTIPALTGLNSQKSLIIGFNQYPFPSYNINSVTSPYSYINDGNVNYIYYYKPVDVTSVASGNFGISNIPLATNYFVEII